MRILTRVRVIVKPLRGFIWEIDVDEKQRQKVASWLVVRRGDASQADFAKLLGVSKSSLQRYEQGSTSLPASVLADWQDRFADFPYVGGATTPERAIEDSYKVEQERAVYDVAPLLGMRLDMTKLRRNQALIEQIFEFCELNPKQHISLKRVLVGVMYREPMSEASALELIRWYADEVVPKMRN